MASAKITEADIRMYLGDRKELNNLLKGVRWSSAEIDHAIQMVVACFNETPPFSVSYNAASFPWTYTLLTGCAAYLLRSASYGEASNSLNYGADGIEIQDRNKAPIFQQIGNALWQEFVEKVANIKVTINLQGAYGTTYSELIFVAR